MAGWWVGKPRIVTVMRGVRHGIGSVTVLVNRSSSVEKYTEGKIVHIDIERKLAAHCVRILHCSR